METLLPCTNCPWPHGRDAVETWRGHTPIAAPFDVSEIDADSLMSPVKPIKSPAACCREPHSSPYLSFASPLTNALHWSKLQPHNAEARAFSAFPMAVHRAVQVSGRMAKFGPTNTFEQALSHGTSSCLVSAELTMSHPSTVHGAEQMVGRMVMLGRIIFIYYIIFFSIWCSCSRTLSPHGYEEF